MDALIFNDSGLVPLAGHKLSFRRGHEWLFKSLDFELAPRQVIWLRGPNGCGKTSLLRLAVGLTWPDEGSVSCYGQRLQGPGAENLSRQLVFIGHTHGLKDDLTATESLMFLARLHGRDASESHVVASLKRMAVHHRRHQFVRVLSQGQRKRVALARLALESAPGIWVLDEPFDALDAQGIATVNGLLKENINRGGCVLLTSHIPVLLDGLVVTELDLLQATQP